MTETPITDALLMQPEPFIAPCWLRWRTGRKVGRTIYAVVGEQPSDDDKLIGLMDTAEIADEVVRAHNACLERSQRA
jgi:hypothetical protein